MLLCHFPVIVSCVICWNINAWKRKSISTELPIEVTSEHRGIILLEYVITSKKSQILYFDIINFAASKFIVNIY